MDCTKGLALVFLLLAGELVVSQSDAEGCPDWTKDDDLLPQDKFIAKLTDPCRYDKYERPNSSTPLEIDAKMDIAHLEVAQSQFTIYFTVQLVYLDNNLNFEKISHKRTTILGDESLKAKIWTPNVVINNNGGVTVLNFDTKDVVVSIDKSGLVVYTYKLVVKYDCWMDLQKFPFDHQKCSLSFTDWIYNSENLLLRWKPDLESPLSISKHFHLSEFVMDTIETDAAVEAKDLSSNGEEFSELIINFEFHRDIGYYMLDFFIPSYFLVFTAWTTFWLQADATPPRATLGVSTVVAFITLHLGVAKDIPKVSYVKASDIWFLGIMLFIFLSLVEFAFANVIWRRKKQVELKKPHPKYILKSAVVPKKAREDLRRYESMQTLSIANLSDDSLYSKYQNGSYRGEDIENGQSVVSIPNELTQDFNWTQMTPQEVAIYIDRKSRIVFPIAFLLFNILYWVFVYCL